MKRTDMACDFLPHAQAEARQIKSYTVTVDGELSRKLNRPEGKYCTVESRAVPDRERGDYGKVSSHIARAVSSFLPSGARRVLVAGLGNPDMTADSLGAEVCGRIAALRCTCDKSTEIGVVVPGVAGVTGVESFDVIAGVTERTRPDVVLAVDSLASAAVSRIAAAFQITDTGITPGSGVSNHRERLSEFSLGVPVISLGVPLVVYASTIIEDATGEECPPQSADTVGRMLVTPKDIDIYVADCAAIISDAVLRAFV